MRTNLFSRYLFTALLLLGSLVGFSSLAASDNWFAPGSLGYPLQRAGEQAIAFLQPNTVGRVKWLTTLVVRRCEPLSDPANTPPSETLLREIEHALDRAASAYSLLAEGGFYQEALRNAAAGCETALELNPAQGAYSRAGILESKLHSLRLVLNSPNARPADTLDIMDLLIKTQVAADIRPASTQSSLVDPRLITFPTNSVGALHTFYPLTGRHAGLGCNQCHPAGNYAGTPGLCVDCHLDLAPLDHYGLVCEACHVVEGWTLVTFDHRVVADRACETCHEAVRPNPHYTGACSACHTPTDWLIVTFDHATAGATDCVACHIEVKPAGHYNGQCSLCHATSAWKPATFNHSAAGATDCAACHIDRKPVNHYAGQCSLCHNTRAWTPATLNHAAIGATDCIACHASRKPANHYDGQCSLCHNTTNWANASFPHTFPTNHKDAANQCAKCHPVSTRTWTCYVCHDQGIMESKHLEKNITNIGPRCLECHPYGTNP